MFVNFLMIYETINECMAISNMDSLSKLSIRKAINVASSKSSGISICTMSGGV